MKQSQKLLKLIESIEPTQNKDWGFWATVKSNFDLTDSMTQTIWDYMGEVLMDMIPAGDSTMGEFLDSKWGRHLADELTFQCKKKSDVAALKKGIDQWSKLPKSKWVIKSYNEM